MGLWMPKLDDCYFQHPWLLKPHFIDGYRKYLKGQNQVETDQFFHDDPDDLDDDQGGTQTQRRPRPGSKNLNQSSIRSVTASTMPQTKISKYFPTENDSDEDAGNLDRTDLVRRAMRKEWWYDMFEVDQAQFDVS